MVAEAIWVSMPTNDSASKWAISRPRVSKEDLRVGFGHSDHGESVTVRERDFDAFEDFVAAHQIERNAGEGGSHLKTGEPGRTGSGFAGREDFAADTAAGEIGMNEEGANFCGVGFGIEELGFADLGMVGAEEGFAFAPAAAAGEVASTGGADFGNKVGAVLNELGVETEHGAEGAFDLFGSVVVGLKGADGNFDELVEGGNVRRCGEAEGEVEVGRHGDSMWIKDNAEA